MSYQPQILAVDDVPQILRQLQQVFSSGSNEYAQALGVGDCVVETADCATVALDKLTARTKTERPFDITILDLELPEKPDDKQKSTDIGLAVLKAIGNENSNSCGAVVILSAHPERVFEVLRTGAADFVPKPFDIEELIASVGLAYQKARERRAKEWEECRRRRAEHWLLVRSCVDVGDRIGRIISIGIGQILGLARKLDSLLEEHYQLSPHRYPDSPVCRASLALQGAAHQTLATCAAARHPTSVVSAERKVVVLGDIVKNVLDELRPGIILRHITVRQLITEENRLLTFSEDVEAIIRELVFQAVEASPEGAEVRIRITRHEAEGAINVAVWDSGPCIDLMLFKSWVNGDSSSQRDKREWQLFLVHQLVQLTAGQLSVSSDADGNSVTLSLPVVNNDAENLSR